tara:strand:+ start:447 stop:770 length:324 start_codon:yes stop_codon:yes gene_type:complete
MYKSIKAYLGLKLLGLNKRDIATGDTVQAQSLVVDSEGQVFKQNAHFIFVQSTPSTSWSVTHNLKKYPSVVVVDSAGTVVIGSVTYNSTSAVTLEFENAFSGKAYFN